MKPRITGLIQFKELVLFKLCASVSQQQRKQFREHFHTKMFLEPINSVSHAFVGFFGVRETNHKTNFSEFERLQIWFAMIVI
jgi:hypothetical protein